MRTRVIRIPLDPLEIVNAHVVRGERAVLVDTGWPGSEPVLLKRLAETGVRPEDLSLILLTHGHVDHFGAAGGLRQSLGVPVAIHRLDADSPRRGGNPPFHATGWAGRILAPFLHDRGTHRLKPFEPDVLIDGEMRLDDFGVAASAIPTPGHTPGCVSLLTDGGEAVVGDLIMGGLIRRWRPGYPIYADDLDRLRQSVRLLLERSPRIIHCAHGGPFTPERVARRFGLMQSDIRTTAGT